MALEFDVTARPHTPAKQLQLLHAIHAATTEDETDWLEWKREADLSQKADQFKIAKMMLGLANRSVRDAHRYVEGFGYVVVGMEPGQVAGTKQLDTADVDSRLSRYLGDQGLGWDLSYHPVEGKNVMLIAVGPPKAGDPIFSLRKEFRSEEKGQGFEAGTIFVRSRTSTARATPAQLEALSQRLIDGSTSATAEIQIIAEKPVVRLTNVNGYRKRMIEAERRRLLDPLPAPAPIDEPDHDWTEHAASAETFSIGSSLLGEYGEHFRRATETMAAQAGQFGDVYTNLGFAPFTEGRDEDEYRATVIEYLDDLETYSFEYELGQALRDTSALQPRFNVENQSDVNLLELDVDVYLPGDVVGFDPPHQPSDERPRAPRCWDVAPRDHPSRMAERLDIPLLSDLPPPAASDLAPGPTKPPFRNSGSVDLNYFLAHLRPRAAEPIKRAEVIVAEEDTRAEIVGQWRATASNVDSVFSGTVHIPIVELDVMSLLDGDSE